MPNVFTKHDDGQIQEQNEKLWRQAKAIVIRSEGKVIWPKVVRVYQTLKRKQEEKMQKDAIELIYLPVLAAQLGRTAAARLFGKYVTLKPYIPEKQEREILLKLIEKIKSDEDVLLRIRRSKYGPHMRYLSTGKKTIHIGPEFKKDLAILAHEYGHAKGSKAGAVIGSTLQTAADAMSNIAAFRALLATLGLTVPPSYVYAPFIFSYVPRALGALSEISASHRGGKLLFELAKDLPLKTRLKLYLMTYKGVPTYLI